MVTLSSSPSMMLLGVRSLWRIPFSLCRYLSASTICSHKHILLVTRKTIAGNKKNHSRCHQRSLWKNWSSYLLKTSISSLIIYIYMYIYFKVIFFPPTCIKMFQILSSGNFIFFSFRELKCSPIGAPSISSITMYNFCSAKKEKICLKKHFFNLKTYTYT